MKKLDQRGVCHFHHGDIAGSKPQFVLEFDKLPTVQEFGFRETLAPTGHDAGGLVDPLSRFVSQAVQLGWIDTNYRISFSFDASHARSLLVVVYGQ
jgi:hypothetical protein